VLRLTHKHRGISSPRLERPLKFIPQLLRSPMSRSQRFTRPRINFVRNISKTSLSSRFKTTELDGLRRWLPNRDASLAKMRTSKPEKRNSRLISKTDKTQSSKKLRPVRALLFSATSSSRDKDSCHHPAKRSPRNWSLIPSKITTNKTLTRSSRMVRS